jgi:carbon monoxide dehydrogenase subunit G
VTTSRWRSSSCGGIGQAGIESRGRSATIWLLQPPRLLGKQLRVDRQLETRLHLRFKGDAPMRLHWLGALVVAVSAVAFAAGEVTVGDLPGTDGQWQRGEAVVAAPPAVVQRWLGDYAAWPSRFPDVEWAQERGMDQEGRAVVRFRSRIVGRTMTIRVHDQPGLITYDGEGKNVVTQGKIYVEPAPGGTRVIMQTTADVHGLAGAFATANLKRSRAFKKLRADLSALVQLGNRYEAHGS